MNIRSASGVGVLNERGAKRTYLSDNTQKTKQGFLSGALFFITSSPFLSIVRPDMAYMNSRGVIPVFSSSFFFISHATFVVSGIITLAVRRLSAQKQNRDPE